MAYRISGTTDKDTALLALIRERAWKDRAEVSATIRTAFLTHLFGAKKNWPEEYR